MSNVVDTTPWMPASVTRAPIKPSLYSFKIFVLLSDNDKGYLPINQSEDASSNCQRERLCENEREGVETLWTGR